MELISVIVPVYNVEKYLRRCIDSILAQTYSNLEIILVDDGSTDNCGKICDDYSKIDSRIKVIHQDNSGVSSARNAGLKSSTGQYITFIDSDDYVDMAYIKTMANHMTEEVDIVVAGFKQFDENHNQINLLPVINPGLQKIDNNFDFNNNPTNLMICSKLFKTRVIRELTFNSNIYLGEDSLFCVQAFINSSAIIYIADYSYNYIRYNSSLSRGVMSEHKYTLIEAWKMIMELFPRESLSRRTSAIKYISFCYYLYGSSVLTLGRNNILTKKIFNTIKNKESKSILKKYDFNFMSRIKYLLLTKFRLIYDLILIIKEPLAKNYK